MDISDNILTTSIILREKVLLFPVYIYSEHNIKNNRKQILNKIHRDIKKYTFNLEDWVTFLGWYLSEGCSIIYYNKRKQKISDYKVIISQSKIIHSDYCLEIENLLKKMSIHFYYSLKSCYFEIGNKILYDYLKQFGKSKNRFIPKEIKNLGREYLQILLDTLIKGDASKYTKNYNIYHTISEQLAKDVQEIALKLNYFKAKILIFNRKNISYAVELRKEDTDVRNRTKN